MVSVFDLIFNTMKTVIGKMQLIEVVPGVGLFTAMMTILIMGLLISGLVTFTSRSIGVGMNEKSKGDAERKRKEEQNERQRKK